MLKAKSLLLAVVLSAGMLFQTANIFASCGCSGPDNCVCIQCTCPGCK